MNKLNWFSSKIRMACLIDAKGLHRYKDSVILFQSESFDSAFKKALELGKKQEESYTNADGQQVVWRLKEIISLDILPVASLDSVEVYSEPIDLLPHESTAFNTEFHPEESKPTQTI